MPVATYQNQRSQQTQGNPNNRVRPLNCWWIPFSSAYTSPEAVSQEKGCRTHLRLSSWLWPSKARGRRLRDTTLSCHVLYSEDEVFYTHCAPIQVDFTSQVTLPLLDRSARTKNIGQHVKDALFVAFRVKLNGPKHGEKHETSRGPFADLLPPHSYVVSCPTVVVFVCASCWKPFTHMIS